MIQQAELRANRDADPNESDRVNAEGEAASPRTKVREIFLKKKKTAKKSAARNTTVWSCTVSCRNANVYEC
jgi:hypothetical protein